MKRLQLGGRYGHLITKQNPLYRVYRNMRTRCYNKNYYLYHRYGGRGIRACDEWKSSFENFYRDMEPSYFPGAQIDRSDNDGDYTPENCRWVNTLEQNRNRSITRLVEYRGEKKKLSEWAKEAKVGYKTVSSRFYGYGWSMSRILEEEAAYRGQK